MNIIITPYPAALDAIERRLTDMGKGDSVNTVLKKALNETAAAGKKEIWKGVHRTYTQKGFAAADVEKKSRSGKNPSATLIVKGSPLGVGGYYKYTKNNARHGVKAKILKAGRMKKLELSRSGSSYKAFLAIMKNGHAGVFQRVPGKYMKKHMPGKNINGREAIKEIVSLSKAKAAERVYEREGLYTELQEELVFRMHKHMNAVISGG